MNRSANDRAVFLDRDGTIMEDSNCVGDFGHVVLIPGAARALKQLQDAGYRLFVITNQSGVGRGYFTRESMEAIHAYLDDYFGSAGVHFDRYYVCPHHPEDNCDCRKPKPKFLLAAAREYGLDLSRCFMIGDRSSDIQAGINAGTSTILVLTGAGRDSLANQEVKPDFVAEDILAAATWILTRKS
ncbi:MAG: HAD family hydrolase [Verrucomicrobiia bacterium]|jgi:D-glycero-D-manno-heptose 1,7-bisphosphate phosphatase